MYCHTEFGVVFKEVPRHQALLYTLYEYHAYRRANDISMTVLVRFSSLNRRNRQTSAIFKILLTAHANSELWE